MTKVREAKPHLESSLAMDIKDNRKGFCRCAVSKRKTRDNMDTSYKELGNLYKENTEVLN